MKSLNLDAIDREIFERIYGGIMAPAGECAPAYSREIELAQGLVELVNQSGRFKIRLRQVVGQAHREDDWQCEVWATEGTGEVLATEYHPHQAVAICRAITGADVRLFKGC